jgi:glutathione S-transferase
MKLYDFSTSPNCRKVRVYLAEKGISIPLRPVNLLAGEQRSPEFLRLNPFGAVPILELDDSAVIPESLAIIEYLEEQYPQPALLGTDSLGRAHVRAWERRCELGVGLQATRRFLHSSPFFASRLVQNPQVVEEATQVLRERLTLMDTQLRDHEWLVGAFSLADITLLTGLDFAVGAGFALEPTWRHLHRWHAAMRARPSAAA